MSEFSDNELTIMKILWKGGALSAREVHEALPISLEWSYSTTRTVLTRMCKKDLISKGNYHGLNLYKAKLSRARGLAGLVVNFAHQVLESDVAPVVSLFSAGAVLDSEELKEMESIIEQMEKEPRA